MERGAWTDARLDDRFDHLDARFDQVDREILGLRQDVRDVRGEVGEMRSLMIRLWSGSLVGMPGLIAAVLARGA
jgi:glutamine synthetase adenylyltransferase